MEREQWMIVMVCIIVSISFTIGWNIFIYKKTKKMYHHLNHMLDHAIEEKFQEAYYDESELSKLETKWKRFLTSSNLSHQKIEEERKQLQSFISDISHQTKTSLSNIKLYSELLEEQIIKSEIENSTSYHLYLEQMKNQVNKLEFLLLSLVKLSRIETGTYTYNKNQESLFMLAKEIKKEYSKKAKEKGITILLEKEGEKEYDGIFDWKWTKEAIENIVDNGIKYSKEGTSLRMIVKQYECFVCLRIQDEGIGMEEEEIPKIFLRFYRGKQVSEQEGVGLGLTLSRQIIMAQEGYIKVESQKGKGTTFSVFLPRILTKVLES